MKHTRELPQSPAAELRLDRLEIYSLTARGLLLAVAIAVAYSIVNGFVG
jgi:hypothetical protein